MFLYYDKSGNLKKQIIDIPFRAGNVNTNTIFVYIEGWKGKITLAQITLQTSNEETSAVWQNMTSDRNSNGNDVLQSGEFIISKDELNSKIVDAFPFKWNYDYYDNYSENDGALLKFTVGNSLIQSGNAVGTIRIFADSNVRLTLGHFAFFIEYGRSRWSDDEIFESLLENYTDTLASQSKTNIIEIVNVNGEDLEPDIEKRVSITVPTKLSDVEDDILDGHYLNLDGSDTMQGDLDMGTYKIIMDEGYIESDEEDIEVGCYNFVISDLKTSGASRYRITFNPASSASKTAYMYIVDSYTTSGRRIDFPSIAGTLALVSDVNNAWTSANSYADTHDTLTLSSAKTYADSVGDTTLASAKNYAVSQDNLTAISCRNYTDVKVASMNFVSSSDSRLSDARTPLPHTHTTDDIENFPTALSDFTDDLGITDLKAKVPNQASSENQLADKDFVNSSIATNTATFRGTYNSGSDFPLPSEETPIDINDYVFWEYKSDTGSVEKYARYKWNGSTWEYEYTLNNSSFTANQWSAINSGVTSANVDTINSLSAVATSGSYNDLKDKPSIPSKTSDLTNDSNFVDNSYHDATKQDKIDSNNKLSYTYIEGLDTYVGGVVADNKNLSDAEASAVKASLSGTSYVGGGVTGTMTTYVAPLDADKVNALIAAYLESLGYAEDESY